jgi:hypothetical protein
VLPTDDSDADADWRGISLQAADRAARFAVRDKLGHGAVIMGDEREKRISRHLSRDWALTIALGRRTLCRRHLPDPRCAPAFSSVIETTTGLMANPCSMNAAT